MNNVKIVFQVLLTLTCLCPSLLVASGGNRSLHGSHAVGDGELLIFGRQSDIVQFLGPPYSSPSFLHLTLTDRDSVLSTRQPGTALWSHVVTRKDREICRMEDVIDSASVSFIREFNATEELHYELDLTHEIFYPQYNHLISVEPADPSAGFESCQANTITLQPGVPFHFVYLAHRGYTYRILVTGESRIAPSDESEKKFQLIVGKGKSMLAVVSVPTEADVQNHIQTQVLTPFEQMRKNSEKWWKSFSSKLSTLASRGYPGEVLEAVDDIAVLLKSQQSAEGVIMAGHYWHMGYVRDQYGGFRGLIAMGLAEEAKQTTRFFYDVWKANGKIRNAQSKGFPGQFNFHENDDVEVTGYLMLQVFQYLDQTGDEAFIKEIFPMLEWLMNVQINNLVDGMLPFNGDETYIAGGVLFRKVIYDGAVEATLLFIEESTRLLDFIRKHRLWDQPKIGEAQKQVDVSANRYRENFFRNGILYAINTSRALKGAFPPTRAGVCLHPEHGGYHTQLFHNKGTLNLCEECMKKENFLVAVPEPEVYEIPSIGLFPIYIDSKLFTENEKRKLLEVVMDRYRKSGQIAEQSMLMGHDYGMFLSALVKFDHPLQDEIYQRMMDLRDDTGSWREYFINGEKPFGRPEAASKRSSPMLKIKLIDKNKDSVKHS